jgi:hypothetical protein
MNLRRLLFFRPAICMLSFRSTLLMRGTPPRSRFCGRVPHVRAVCVVRRAFLTFVIFGGCEPSRHKGKKLPLIQSVLLNCRGPEL